MMILALFALVVSCIFGLGTVIYPYVTGEIRAEARQQALSIPNSQRQAANDRNRDVESRRKQVANTLKEIDSRKHNKITLELRLQQAGLNWPKQQYYMLCAGTAVFTAAVTLYLTRNVLFAALGAFIGATGLPIWILNFLKKRRLNTFLDQFPNAIDMIVRGVKAGLPLNDCLKNIANEVDEPVRGEFRQIVDAQVLGMTTAEAVEGITLRVPAPEANFFAIVIAIQQKAGGNLAEAMANLSKILRERKKMKQKIKAMSSEAVASAGIIGSLPILNGLGLYVLMPDYIIFMFVDPTGQIALACAAAWMSIGIFIMKRLISFDM